MNPYFSIITINKNNASGLEKTISSVISQTFSDFEYIIVDGGSTDSSCDILSQYAQYCTSYVSEPDTGIYNAQNKGIKKAKGKYCLVLNSGDYLHDEHVLQKIFNQKPEADILYGDALADYGDGKFDKGIPPNPINLVHLYLSTIWHPASLTKRSLFDEIGNYDENLVITADYKFFLEALIKHQASSLYLPFTISVFDTKGISSSPKFEALHQSEKNTLRSVYFSPMIVELIKEKIYYHQQTLYYQKSIFYKLHMITGYVANKLKQLYSRFKQNQIQND
jgi:glycosyltransferase involved in cell wall biosynthesis